MRHHMRISSTPSVAIAEEQASPCTRLAQGCTWQNGSSGAQQPAPNSTLQKALSRVSGKHTRPGEYLDMASVLLAARCGTVASAAGRKANADQRLNPQADGSDHFSVKIVKGSNSR